MWVGKRPTKRTWKREKSWSTARVVLGLKVIPLLMPDVSVQYTWSLDKCFGIPDVPLLFLLAEVLGESELQVQLSSFVWQVKGQEGFFFLFFRFVRKSLACTIEHTAHHCQHHSS